MAFLDSRTHPDGSGVKFCSGMVVSDPRLMVSDPRPRPLGPLGPLGTRDQGPGTRDQGPGARDQGPGTRDQGPGARDQGPGARGMW